MSINGKCTSDVCFRVEAFQSVLQLMGEKEMFEYFDQTSDVASVAWSQDHAKRALETWQRNFSDVSSEITSSSVLSLSKCAVTKLFILFY